MKLFLYSSVADTTKKIYLFYELNYYIEEQHVHDFYEIIYVTSGEIEEVVNNEKFNVSRGDLLFIDLKSTHSFTPKSKISFYNICLQPSLLEENADSLIPKEIISMFYKYKDLFINKVLSFSGDERRIFEEMLQSMIIEQNSKNILSDQIINSFLSIILSKIINKVQNPELNHNSWEELDKYIENNLDSDLSLHYLASRSFYNPSYFSRLFKQHHGESLISYINNKKIEKAKLLLTTTDLSIDEISTNLGYSNISVFYRNFTKITSLTPIAYKQKYKQK